MFGFLPFGLRALLALAGDTAPLAVLVALCRAIRFSTRAVMKPEAANVSGGPDPRG